jgi:hypothetical protein
MRVIDIMVPKIIPPTRIKRITEVMLADSVRIPDIACQPPFLKAKTDTKATKAPTAPASVGVKIPVKIPPIIISIINAIPQAFGIEDKRSFQEI